ncbi:MAG: GntR family transcriptional regulator [Hyphomicrobiaceae bacterium]|nr:GntR family transcriptional regulator [Hyphomicrobiaceae bacterium]
MKQPLDSIVAVNLGETAYQNISDALIKGYFGPNEQLTIRALAKMLGTSSTPARDAVNRLIQDGALEQRSLRDIRVPIISEARYLEIAVIRTELEGLAAARAAEFATDANLKILDDLIRQNEIAIDEMSWGGAASLNQEFHFSLADAARMPVLRSVLHSLWLKIGPLLAGYYERGGRRMIDHHYEIFEAVKSKDPERAREAIRYDINDPVEDICIYLRERVEHSSEK